MKKIFLLLTAVLTAGMLSAETIYGDCGTNMEWEFNTGSGALYLIGTGPMNVYASFRETPWAQYKDQIKSIQKDSRSQYTTIGDCAFAGCKNLTSVDLPNTVTKISRSAFYNCSGLTSVTIPNSVTSIGNYAFYGCTGLTTVTISNSVTSIGNNAFYGTGLTSLVYNAHVFAFMPPSYSGAYTIPDGIEIIAGGAFEYCRGLTSVTIPNSVTSIGDKAFYGCRGLKTIIIPASVQTIGTAAFSSCANLTVIQVSAINPYYIAVDGVLYNKNKTILHQFPAGKNVTSFTISNTVTEISGSAFEYCRGLTSVTIPNSVTSIGEYAFYYCSGLTSVTIPNSVTSIGNYAFYNCTDLTSPVYNAHVFAYMPSSYSGEYTIPDGIEIISSTAFYNCSNLTSVTIPNSVTSIGDYAFEYCTGLTTITCKAVNPPALGDDVFYDVDTTIPLYVPASSVNTYKSTEPWSYFGNNILPIGGYITSGICGKDGEGNLADNLTWTFDPETGTLTIEGSGEMMDFDYNGIPWLDFAMQITNVTLPDGLTSIGARAFYNCSSLASINIPESVTEINMLAFFYCSSLTSIVIPEGTKSLFETFKGCESLSSVVIPASVTSLTFETFGGCVSLKEITNYATTPQSVEEDVFDQVDKANCKLYVPSSAVEAYRAAEVWKDFDIQAAQGIEDIVVPTGEAQKILMNGTLLIERNGKTYNAQGAKVR